MAGHLPRCAAVVSQIAKHFLDLREKRISSQISTTREQALADDNKIKSEKIAKAEEKQRELEVQLVETRAKVAEAQKLASQIDDWRTPRDLSSEINNELVEYLKTTTSIRLDITTLKQHEESVRFGLQLREVFETARWPAGFSREIPPLDKPNPKDVVCVGPIKIAEGISRILNHHGIKATSQAASDSAYLRIIVGIKSP